jgi:hypothetical protein
MLTKTHFLRGLTIFGASLALLACDASSDSSDTGSTASTGGTSFAAGNFQLTTTEANDACLGGGLEILFMPNGANSPYDLANVTEFPAASDLPKTYNITLQAPFSEMEVTVSKGASDNMMQIRNSKQTGVKVDEANYGDCTVDMDIDADITIVDSDNLNVAATISVTNWQGGNDMKCPMAQSDPCEVKLTMTGKRQ